MENHNPFLQLRRCLVLFILAILVMVVGLIPMADGLGVNWGTRATHPLPPNIVVRLMKDNGINKVKLFEAEAWVLKSLGNSGIQVMLGIPNDFLASLASSVKAAEDWVAQNVSSYISQNGVDIRYIAVGNEPFLKTYKDAFLKTTYPAVQNVQAALIKAGLGRDVKVTVPLNADVYESDSGLPSGGNFRSDISDLMTSLIKFLSDNGSPITINIYPFLSLYADAHFPIDFAFFPGDDNSGPNATSSSAAPLVDGPISYTNVFEANFDTLVWALEKNGFSSMPIIVGEVGWPTDGDTNANMQYARRFNQGLLDRVIHGQGTPKHRIPPDIYFFGLIDEDAKSIQPGNFERHWGIFNFDGTTKYPLKTSSSSSRLVPAKGVRYLARQWCVMSPQASESDPNLPQSINNACTYADCTSLGYGSSCGGLDVRSNASYAFNKYFQTMNQQKGSCDQFNSLSVVTNIEPSPQNTNCRYEIMIDLERHERTTKSPRTSSSASMLKRRNSFTSNIINAGILLLSSLIISCSRCLISSSLVP